MPANRWNSYQKSFLWPDEFPPACTCGCGEPAVYSTKNRKQTKFANLGHREWFRAETGRQNAWNRWPDGLSGEEFSKALRKLKDANGWSYEDMGRLTGRSRSNMFDMVAYPGKVVDRKIAEDVLSRLAGRATLATERQAKEYAQTRVVVAREDRAETLRENKLNARKQAVAALRDRLGYGPDQ